ncbi:MAG: DUF87 domain-containing protein, partial [Cenarchaeum sp. SB0669_bin_11]|nr:DUF87 domain-containing protein [Cenarchaeum sp. SB0669_bin_11]
MLSRDPTFLGTVAAVSGAACSVHLASSIQSGLSIFQGQTYKIGQVGSFVRVPQGYQDLFGVVSEIGAKAVPDNLDSAGDTGRWMKVELVGEVVGETFERGVGQYPNIGDSVHVAVEEDLHKLYDIRGRGHIVIGKLASAESIAARVALNELVTRHCAVLGSTGSGKSTTISSLLRSITDSSRSADNYPNARILLLDIHGEYSKPMADVAQVFSVEPRHEEDTLFIPYWALDSDTLLEFLTGGLEDNSETAFTDKIYEQKCVSHELLALPEVDSGSITVDTPLPFSLKQLWYDLIDFEITTFEGPDRDQSTKQTEGDPNTLTPPTYKPHGLGSAGPLINQQAIG